jgi:hypothetical protein
MRRGLGWEQRGYVSVKSALVGLLPAAVDCRVLASRLLVCSRLGPSLALSTRVRRLMD